MSVSTAETGLEAQPLLDAGEATHSAHRRHADHWVWQVTALSFVLGIMLALAINTTQRMRGSGIPGGRFGISAAILSTYKETNKGLQKEISDLRKQVEGLEQNERDGSNSYKLLQEQLAALRASSGLSAVHGPGLKVTLRDSPERPLPNLTPEDLDSYKVHDQDINGLISELKAAGAEALAITGGDGTQLQRVVVTTTARCVGPHVMVNGIQMAPPYTVFAIGSPKDLRGALEMPEGFIQMRSLDVLKMITIEESEALALPEYSGSIPSKYARPATP